MSGTTNSNLASPSLFPQDREATLNYGSDTEISLTHPVLVGYLTAEAMETLPFTTNPGLRVDVWLVANVFQFVQGGEDVQMPTSICEFQCPRLHNWVRGGYFIPNPCTMCLKIRENGSMFTKITGLPNCEVFNLQSNQTPVWREINK